MYTEAMKRAFHSLKSHCPEGFFVDIIDNNDFLVLRVYPEQLVRLSDFEQRRATEYVVRVFKALEDNGATVLLVRNAIDQQKA